MIYTKTGDKGTTSLANGERVAKTDLRVEAYGTVDELNSWIGMLRAHLPVYTTLFIDPDTMRDEFIAISTQLEYLQNKLFNLGAQLSQAPGEWITEDDVQQLEHWIDAMQTQLPRQKGFLLPMGGEAVTRCHVCRTVCRRAERRMIDAQADETALRFINRLSDYLFVLSRMIAYMLKEQEFEWKKD